MIEGMLNALSGLRSSSKRLQNSANNVANVQSSGFKKSQVDLSSQKSGGVKASSTSRSNSQGSIVQTSNPLDLAISGKGFFQISLANGGTGFTRSGSFKADSGGRLVTSDGNAVTPEITVPGNATNVSVGKGGEVSAQVGGTAQNIGQIQLASFNNAGGLSAAGGNTFLETSASGAPVTGNPGAGGVGDIISGALELSNVDIASEVVDQIASKQAFQANAKVIKTNDEIIGTILDIKA